MGVFAQTTTPPRAAAYPRPPPARCFTPPASPPARPARPQAAKRFRTLRREMHGEKEGKFTSVLNKEVMEALKGELGEDLARAAFKVRRSSEHLPRLTRKKWHRRPPPRANHLSQPHPSSSPLPPSRLQIVSPKKA